MINYYTVNVNEPAFGEKPGIGAPRGEAP